MLFFPFVEMVLRKSESNIRGNITHFHHSTSTSVFVTISARIWLLASSTPENNTVKI